MKPEEISNEELAAHLDEVKGHAQCPLCREAARRLRRMECAMDAAVEVIKQWHGPEAWDLYWSHAPEMKLIREWYAEGAE